MQEEKECIRCSKKIPIEDKYCLHCGVKQYENKGSIKSIIWFIVIVLILINGVLVIRKHHKSIFRFASELIHKPQKISGSTMLKTPNSEQNKINKVIQKYHGFVFGIDVSHYQGLIQWNKVKIIKGNTNVNVSFAIIRATMGSNKIDQYYTHNWKSTKKRKIIRGAYHYYRPNENSLKQANNYINKVKLSKGDLPPILDIEQVSSIQSISNLRKGLLKWLVKVESHYCIRPIIYTGETFYNKYLSGSNFKKYKFWIANYNNMSKPKANWIVWQFSQKGKINGIDDFVDLNVYNGNIGRFKSICK